LANLKLQQETRLKEQELQQDIEKERIQADLERERIQLQKVKLESRNNENDGENEASINSKVRKLKQFGDAIRNMVSKMNKNTPHKISAIYHEIRSSFRNFRSSK